MDQTTDYGEVTIARNYDQRKVILETDASGDRLLEPDAARGLAQVFRKWGLTPKMPKSVADRVANELERAADDVETAR